MFNIDNFVLDTNIHDLFEGMTSISAVIRSILSGSSNRQIIAVLYDKDRTNQKFREISFLMRNSNEMSFAVIPVQLDIIEKLSSGDTHGGIVAITTKRTFSNTIVKDLTNKSFYALIDGIEDPYNFAYSIRALYAAGVDGIILPPRNWMNFSGVVARSSAGTSELIDMYVCDTIEAVENLKKNGFKVVCASIRDSVSIYDYDFTQPILLVVGGEKRGISRKILDMADANVRIDYGRDFMGSLPSASAISVISFEIAHQKSLLKNKS